jgi:hypothetical protein
MPFVLHHWKEITIREATEWITRHNRGYHLGHEKDSLWTEESKRAFNPWEEKTK